MDLANDISCTYEAAKDTQRKLNNSTSLNTLRNSNIEKYIPSGADKFIKYRTSIEEFTEYCLSKPIKPIVKLNFLKASFGGDALELVQNYTHGSQLEALETLENVFSNRTL